jgi:hypothetical protein
MTAKELIQAGPSGVRNSSTLMAEYKRIFFEQFNYEPECPTCGSTKDWNLFKSFANGTSLETPTKVMSDKTFKLRDTNKIYTYAYEDKKTGRSLNKRRFGYLMEEEFAEEYLTNGTPEQIEKRKAEFKTLPEKFRDTQEPDKLTELKELASERGYSEEEYKDITEEAEMVAYLEAKAKAEAEEAERIAKEEADRKEKEEAERIAKEKAESEAKAKAEAAAKKEGKVK